MSLEKCNSCGSEFLTEADPYIVRPTKDGLKLYCSCYIVGHNQFDHVDKIKELEAKNAKLEKKLEIAKDTLERLDKITVLAESAKYIIKEALAAINGE